MLLLSLSTYNFVIGKVRNIILYYEVQALQSQFSKWRKD